MKTWIITLTICVFFITSLISAQESSSLRSVQCIQSIDSLKKGRLLNNKLWITQDKLRMEYMQEEQVYVMIIANNKAYNFIPSRQFGTVTDLGNDSMENYQINPELMQNPQKLRDYLVLTQAVRVGEDNLDGHLCDIYQYIEPDTRNTTTLWVDKKEIFLVKSTTKLVGDIITVRYKNIVLGKPISKDKFIIPKNVRIEPLRS